MKLKNILPLALLGCALTAAVPDAHAQKGQKYGTTADKKAKALVDEGRDLMLYVSDRDLKTYLPPLQKFKEALDRDPNYLEALYMSADIYKTLGEYELQVQMIQRGVGVDSTFFISGYYACANSLARLKRYEEAMHWFDLFDRFSKGKKIQITKDPKWRAKTRQVLKLLRNPVPFEPEYPTAYIEKAPFETYWPSVSLDETELVMTSMVPLDTAAFNRDPSMFGSRNTNKMQEDMYICTRKSPAEPWQPMRPLKGVNTAFNEGTQTLSADGRWMFYTACGYADSHGSCDIYFTQRTTNGWTRGVNIGKPVNSPGWETQPCFSTDGKTLFFVRGKANTADRGSNIYMATVKGIGPDGVPRFDIPKALGDSVNTHGNETHPFIHPDGKSLYFSSDTWPGLGGFDLFVSRLKPDGRWSTPVNLGYPINDVENDEGLVLNAAGNTGYYNATRIINGTPKREVRMFHPYDAIRPTPVPFARGVITSCKTKKSIDATLLLDRISDGKRIITARTLPDGSFTVALPGEDDYLLSVSAPGYFFRSQKFSVADIANLQGPKTFKAEEVCLNPLEIGQKIELRNIYFDTDKWDIKPESAVELDQLLIVLRENPKLRLEISGHTDSRASVKHNQVLSENRAKATVKYLVDHGIAANRFTMVGYGLSRPCATNDTEEGRALNRRIEAKIIP